MKLEPGALILVAVKERPAPVRFIEVYTDRAACEAHPKAPRFLEYRTLTAGMVSSLQLLKPDPIMLGVKAGGLLSWDNW